MFTLFRLFVSVVALSFPVLAKRELLPQPQRRVLSGLLPLQLLPARITAFRSMWS